MYSVIKDPQANLTYSFDWSPWLDTDTITASEWVASGPDALLSVVSDSKSSTASTVRLSGGTLGREYSVTNHITTASGDEDDRTITVTVVQK